MVTKKVLDETYALTDGYCAYCGKKLAGKATWHLEHVIPKSQGGRDKDNLVAACPRCNMSKGILTPSQWKTQIPRKVWKAIESRIWDIEGIADFIPQEDVDQIFDALQTIHDVLETTQIIFRGERILQEIEDKWREGD